MTSLIDAFIFNDEIEILHFRLESYRNLVDFTVIAESQYSFSGKPKRLKAREYLESISFNMDKIIFINYAPPENLIKNSMNDRWAIERFARQSLSESFKNFSPDTRILISDVDELPSPEQIEMAVSSSGIQTLMTPLYHRKANWLSLQGKEWSTAKIGPISSFDDLNSVRYAKYPIIKKYPGMHLSYLSKFDSSVIAKAENSAHSEHDLNQNFLMSAVSWANEYHLEHLPRFNRKYQGRLVVKSDVELTGFQRKFLALNESFFDFEQPKHSNLERRKASLLLYRAWEKEIPINKKRVDVKFLDLTKSLVATWLTRQKKRIQLRLTSIWKSING